LAAIAGVLPDHWQEVYGYRPVLLETFVEIARFKGTCYKAANWLYLGQTKGRGKLGPAGKQSVPITIAALILPAFAIGVGVSHCDEGVGRYPGFFWSQARNRSDLIGEPENSVVEGAIEQGFDVYRINDRIRLNAFVLFEGKRDEQMLDWNRRYEFSVGVQLRYFGIPRTLVSAGARYDMEKRTVSGDTYNGTTGFVNWGSYWDLGQLLGFETNKPALDGYPGTTWGEIRFPASHTEEESRSIILEGAVEQGIDWARLTDNVSFNTFSRLEYKFDTKNLDWNNKVSIAPGAKFKLKIGNKGLVEIGAKYQWEHRFESGKSRSGTVLFLNWNQAWEFGEFAQK
jgi:hypothetical protein